MEIEGEDGSRTEFKDGTEIVFGRGNGFNPNDPIVSRRHILFHLKPSRVSFQAIGKNPIWVRFKESGGIKAFRRGERGELKDGDLFCVSSNEPVWFSVKKVEDDWSEIRASSSEEEDMKLGDELEMEVSSGSELTGNVQDLGLGFDSIDVSNIDPVKEFGFLVIGHEFDNYPKGKIRDVKSWNWFLEDGREASTDEEDDTDRGKGKKKALSRKRKKRNDKDEDDEEWTGESEEEEVIAKSTGLGASKYSIRSKDLRKGRPKKDSSTTYGSAEKRSKRAEEEEDDDEEEEGDETLGGFIVGDGDDDVEEVDEDDEEEFEEDDFVE